MPRPTYELDRKNAPPFLLTILVATFAVVAAAAGIVIERIEIWFGP